MKNMSSKTLIQKWINKGIRASLTNTTKNLHVSKLAIQFSCRIRSGVQVVLIDIEILHKNYSLLLVQILDF